MMMSKILHILFFLLLSSFLQAQQKACVSGRITDCCTQEPIRNVTVKLVGSDGSSLSVLSDSAGNYTLAGCFRPHTAYLISTDPETAKRHKDVQYGLCPYAFNDDSGYLYSTEKAKLSFADSLRSEKHDFCLDQALVCGRRFPEFFFQKNSADVDKADWMNCRNADTCMDCLVSFLAAYRTFVIEIAGHASEDEHDKNRLAEIRAKSIYDQLIQKGIDPRRLRYKSYGDTKPYQCYDENGMPLQVNDKKLQQQQSRRATIRLLSRDYEPAESNGAHD